MSETTKLTPKQKWDQADLSNSFIFYKVMRDHPDACQHLLEILLKIKIEQMEIHNEEVIEVDAEAKGIRLDIFVKDIGRMFDIELQVINTKELPERARYYSSLMTLDSLKSGQKYSDLLDSHVIFICMENVFNNSLPVCTFENICLEDGKTKLNDRDYKHFFIAPLCAKMLKDKALKSFFDFLVSNHATDDYTNDLKKYVSDAKQNMNYKRQFMEWERQRTYDFDAGKEAGKYEKAIEAAKNLYTNGVSIELIAKSLNMTIEQIKEIVFEAQKA